MLHTGIGGALLAATALWLASAVPAEADCVSDCQAATYCDSEMHASGECADRLNACYLSECSKPKVLYGAIAYDAESGAIGWSFDFAEAPGAEEKALAGCKAHGTGCAIVVDFWNTCAAVAAAGPTVAYGLGRSEHLAESEALAACAKDGGSSCEIQGWSCTNNEH